MAVFLDTLDLRSYDEKGVILESGARRPFSEQRAIERNRRSFFEILFYLTYAGFYKRPGPPGKDLEGIPDRWYSTLR